MDNIKACLFDFDGTLVDSMPVWAEKMFRILKIEGITPPDGLLRIITPLGDKGTIKYFKENFPIKMTEKEMQKEMDDYAFVHYRDNIEAKTGVHKYLEKLKSDNIGIYLLTASPRKMFEPCLRRLGLYDYFDNLWSCEDFKTVKSNPEIYKMAAEKMNVKVNEVMFFDDNKNAVETSKTAGNYTVGVYDESSEFDEAEIRNIADKYIYSFSEL